MYRGNGMKKAYVLLIIMILLMISCSYNSMLEYDGNNRNRITNTSDYE